MLINAPTRENPTAAWLKFWGVRGSIPSPGPDTAYFGGNTSCVELRSAGQHIILDAGSGIRELGLALMAEGKDLDITLLLTHMHWDHIQGFPFFVPAYVPRHRVRVMGYPWAMNTLEAILGEQMQSPFFPVTLAEMPGKLTFEPISSPEFQIGELRVRTCQTKHPGTTLGFRIETPGGSICYVPDHESAPGEPPGPVGELIAGADILIFDAQYTPEEYPSKRGWGHGCLDDVVRVAGDAGVQQLYLFHHDPSHSDFMLTSMLSRARMLARDGMTVEVAREGETLELLLP